MQTIKLPREVGIKKARKMYAAAAAVLAKGPDCALDFANVDRFDLSIAQIILALGRECGSRGGKLMIRNANEAMARRLRLSGVEPEGAHSL
jgi:anti-anti-sigma regulatory factor